MGFASTTPTASPIPAGYLARLAERGVERIWVEKIIEPGELLPDWPVEGTTGYEFMADATALFIDPAGEEPLTALYAELTGETRPFEEVAAEAKLAEARTTFEPEVERLRSLLDEPDMAEAVAALPVYRTYLEPETDAENDPHDAEAVEEAELPERVREALVAPADPDEEAFAVRFQQTTGAVMAKGVEDTALYRYTRLVALNEVGADPGRLEHLPRADARGQRRARRALPARPAGHPDPRHQALGRRAGADRGAVGNAPASGASGCCAGARSTAPLRAGGAPDPSEEYLIYQTLVGAWPLERERLAAYIVKAMREAKVEHGLGASRTSATRRAVLRFCAGSTPRTAFRADLEDLLRTVAPRGEDAALGQTLLKLTSPGVPDIYQGDELWASSLVDPDNRRPVDWDAPAGA